MAKGRERDPAKEKLWRERVERQQRSGLSVREFCRREGLPEPSMYVWRREIARRDAESDAKLPGSKASFHRGGKPRTQSPQKLLGRSESSVGAFLPLQVIDSQEAISDQSRAAIEIVLASNLRVLVRPGFDPLLLRQVVETLSFSVALPSC